MLLLVSLAIFIIARQVFSRYFYQNIAILNKKTYIVPKRFYSYFLFLILLLIIVPIYLIFEDEIYQIAAFSLLYFFSCYFLFKKGFQSMGYFVIKIIESCVQANLLIFSLISVIVILLIFYTIFTNAFVFLKEIGIFNFLFKANWIPENYLVDPKNSFGIIPLIINTMYITLFSVIVSFGFGLLISLYISEYIKSKRLRFFLKSFFEIVAGIPSIFYGFIGAFFLAPGLVSAGEKIGIEISLESIIIPGISIGVMMAPYVITLLDDVFSAIPRTLKDCAAAMGLTRFESIKNLIIPVSRPEIISTLIIIISRVLGETMIVLITCGVSSLLTLNPFRPSTTITVQIVHLLTGDTSFDSIKTLSVFGLSLFLFIATMFLNILSIKIKNKHKN